MSDLSLADLVRNAAERWPERVAWTFDALGRELTFAEVDRRSDAFAALLAEHGVTATDRVAVMLDNRPEFPLAWLGATKLGAAVVPVNIRYQDYDAAHVLAHSGARVVLTTAQHAELLARIRSSTSLQHVLDVDAIPIPDAPAPKCAAPVPETVANIQYTSGTTGAPKGCVLPHRYWTSLAAGLVEGFPRIGAQDTILTAQPFHYVDPQWNTALGLASGARLVVLDRFHPTTFWSKVREHEVTWLYCLGLMPKLLLDMPPSPHDRDHRVRAISASAIPADLHAALEKRWGVPWFEAFGMTETGSDIRMTPEDHDDTVGTGCLGRAIAGREVAILGDSGEPVPRGTTGELAIRGVGLMHGYFRDAEATDRAFRSGWFHTGDLARMDDRGRVYYAGRTKDMIRRSGENITAGEVERVLQLHPAVDIAAVLPEPDELRGEEVHAVLVLRDETCTPEDLAAFCGEQLAYFKVPRYWTFRTAVPLTPSERVSKAALRTELAQDRSPKYDRKTQQWT
ncbi:crotonobetaine/carnitine-CoA ligase [Saccharopolyspora antimicrobica]|uniref:Crotonobetaine/carnitine-CoA ligase n=1 Tax=Saccharopolyspora antimicrobica TaxID=455193 RepID=A0A1I5A9I0_9PSEU|nr:AMP-binding protein [Saccharopolyspora antimicrobica]RKT83225.1 crotonobetaine/carnitine-CoA ligase [Saccharopolyspora antimicrobica]SFN58990.1 crotonobetaine/carnitine-CoA ligase [Saccharopolyspora antimicrobica]